MREPPCFEGSLDPNHYLKWVQALEDYLRVNGCSDEDSFMIPAQKLQGFTCYWFKCPRKERALEGKPRIKTWRSLKSYTNVRFYRDLLFEGCLEEKSIVVREKIMI